MHTEPAPIDIDIDIARSPADIEGILALQRRNLRTGLSAEAQAEAGFVFAEHTAELLQTMAAKAPQAVARSAGRVVGYSLAMTPEMQDFLPSLRPMFEQFGCITWRGRALSARPYVVGGQVCVDASMRGRGLIQRLYAKTRDSVPAGIELCLTEIAERNTVSLRAHARIGFVEVGRYRAEGEDWVVVAWPWRESAAAQDPPGA